MVQAPDALADGLENKIADDVTRDLFIVNPLPTHEVDNLFTTHPSLANRIERLRKLANIERRSMRETSGPWGW